MKLKWIVATLSIVVMLGISFQTIGPVHGQAVNPASRNIIRCHVDASTATTLQAFGGQCVAPGSRQSIYITDVIAGSSAASSTTADSAPTLKAGTGGTCGTATVVLTALPMPANTSMHVPFGTPIKVPANNEICWINSPAGTKWMTVIGYIEKG